MFSWCRAQIREFGKITGAQLICRVAWSRATVGFANKFLRRTVECPCCGWTGHRFHDYIEVGYRVSNSTCPQCESQQRHRAFYFWLQNEFWLQEKKGRALVFAPEQALACLWDEARQLEVIRVDLEFARGVDLLADLEKLPLRSDSIELVWCHHVLEHIQHDRKAIGEIHRVLSSDNGQFIVSVPLEKGTTTREYGVANKFESGHWRMYGDDFVERLAETGFDVQTINYVLPPQESTKYGLTAETFYVCRKLIA